LRKKQCKRTGKGADAVSKLVTVQDCIEFAFWQYLQHYSSHCQSTFFGSHPKSPHPQAPQQEHHAVDDVSPIQDLSQLRIRFAGRTDKGVHARGQVVTCFLPKVEHLGSLLGALNSRLPPDISLQAVITVPPDFCPRKHPQVCKTYSYTMTFRRVDDFSVLPLPPGSSVPSLRQPLDLEPTWIVPWPLYVQHNNHNMWLTLSNILTGTHDYTPFCHKSQRNKTEGEGEMQLRTIQAIQTVVLQEQPCPYFPGTSIVKVRWEFTAAGFARGLVRHLVGFLVHVVKVVGGTVPSLKTNDSIATKQEAKTTTSTTTSTPPPLPVAMLHDPLQLWDSLLEDPSTETTQTTTTKSVWKDCIHMAPACGLCLESVTYKNKEDHVNDN
jgi:tRNA pseudouridine(38-40) synthase